MALTDPPYDLFYGSSHNSYNIVGSYGSYYPSTTGTSYPLNLTSSSYPYTAYPVSSLPLPLTPEAIDFLCEKLVTCVGKDEQVIVCVDSDTSPAMLEEFASRLTERGIRGIVIRGARAGTGFPLERLPTPEEERVDILARIGEMWRRRPDLRLTDLLSWYTGEQMEDRDFAAAVEVHFEKVTDGVYTCP